MNDKLFDKLIEIDAYGWKWQGSITINFSGETHDVELKVQGNEQTEITERQKDAFNRFIDKFPKIQDKIIDALIKYYNKEERFSYGLDSEEGMEKWWPDIKSKDELLKAVTLESIVVAEDYIMDKGRTIYLLFSRRWDGEDLEDNGIGVKFVNETINKIAYKDIAFWFFRFRTN